MIYYTILQLYRCNTAGRRPLYRSVAAAKGLGQVAPGQSAARELKGWLCLEVGHSRRRWKRSLASTNGAFRRDTRMYICIHIKKT